MNSAAPITGSGRWSFEVWHDWLTPPPEMAWGDTHGLAQDSSGNIYVAHTVGAASMHADAIFVYDEGGCFLRRFGGEFRGGAHGLAVRREEDGEFLYVTDVVRCTFSKLTLAGDTVWQRAYPRDVQFYAGGPTPFCPTNFAFAPDGTFFLVDGYGSNHVLRFDRHGKFLSAFGRTGSGDGELSCPHGVHVDTRGDEPRLLIADRGNFRLQVFTLDGRHLQTVAQGERLRWPCHIHQQGEWLVCPDLDSQVCVLDRDYRVVAQLGDGKSANGAMGSRRWQPRDAFTPGQFITPHMAIFLRDGSILVAEWVVVGRITRLVPRK